MQQDAKYRHRPCCALRGPDGILSPLRWMSIHLHHCMENAGWSSRRFVPFLSIFSPSGFPLFLNKTAIQHHSCLEDADQSRISGCLAASGSCMPSAADKGWHSLKRPYSTVAVNSLSVCTEVSCYFFLSRLTLLLVMHRRMFGQIVVYFCIKMKFAINILPTKIFSDTQST